MAPFRPQYEFSDERIQALARKLGVTELTNFRAEDLENLDAAEVRSIKAAVKRLVFDALDLVTGDAPAPIPLNAIVLDDKFKVPFFQDLARRTTANEAKGERRAPAEVLAERFRTKPGEPVWMTEAQLAEEAVRIYHESGKQSKTVQDVVSEAIASRCQSQISNYLQTQYGSVRTARKRDYSHLELAHAILQASLEGKSEIIWHQNGERLTYQVPAWRADSEGNGYRNQYEVITPSYLIKACDMPPINRRTNLNKVLEWIQEANVQGITLKVKGTK